jgi:hypothetical protein
MRALQAIAQCTLPNIRVAATDETGAIGKNLDERIPALSVM